MVFNGAEATPMSKLCFVPRLAWFSSQIHSIGPI